MGNARIGVTGAMISLDPSGLITQSTTTAMYALVAEGLPLTHAAKKLGINKRLLEQISKIAEKYISYYGEGEETYIEKIGRNSVAGQKHIEECVNFYISCERAEAEFAETVVQSIMRGVEENPELALKVAERRFSEEWGQKKESNVNVKTESTIKTIQINVPADVGQVLDADFEEAA